MLIVWHNPHAGVLDGKKALCFVFIEQITMLFWNFRLPSHYCHRCLNLQPPPISTPMHMPRTAITLCMIMLTNARITESMQQIQERQRSQNLMSLVIWMTWTTHLPCRQLMLISDACQNSRLFLMWMYISLDPQYLWCLQKFPQPLAMWLQDRVPWMDFHIGKGWNKWHSEQWLFHSHHGQWETSSGSNSKTLL